MKLSTKDMTKVAFMAGAMAVVTMVFRFYPVAFGTVPFSLGPFMVVLAGGILGANLGAWSMAVYILLGFAGLQVFATEPFGGPAYFLKPTCGFLFSYILAAWVSGWLIQKMNKDTLVIYIGAMLAGMVVIYTVGLSYFYVAMNFYLGKSIAFVPLFIGFVPFILGDIVKALAAAAVSRAVMRRLKYRLPDRG